MSSVEDVNGTLATGEAHLDEATAAAQEATRMGSDTAVLLASLHEAVTGCMERTSGIDTSFQDQQGALYTANRSLNSASDAFTEASRGSNDEKLSSLGDSCLGSIINNEGGSAGLNLARENIGYVVALLQKTLVFIEIAGGANDSVMENCQVQPANLREMRETSQEYRRTHL